MTINIAMTSFPRRITNCVKVINSILDNTVQPDRIYLTLSHLEFPNYEQDLPSDLYRLVMTSNKLILNWVEKNINILKFWIFCDKSFFVNFEKRVVSDEKNFCGNFDGIYTYIKYFCLRIGKWIFKTVGNYGN